MGSRASKAVVDEPYFDRTAVDRLCKEAYAAGAGDASAHYQAVLESQWRMDTAAGLGGCAITLLLSYMYFGARMAQSDAQASRLVEAERSHVMRMQQESDALQTQLGKLEKDNARLWRVVCRSAATGATNVTASIKIASQPNAAAAPQRLIGERSGKFEELSCAVESACACHAMWWQRGAWLSCCCMYLRLCDNLRGECWQRWWCYEYQWHP
ncbi:hypothetical protein TcBrA4_0069610 [Trypanosoma cruzi]|nr:hypothetical protein TcBrA4_0069610 [Trypanosoma cruzi]